MTEKRQTTRPYKIAYLILSVLTILLVLVAFGLFYPYKTIEFKAPYQTEKTTYIQGEQTYYIVNYCKFTDVFPTLTKKFVDGIEFTAVGVRAVLKKGCSKELIPLEIPNSLPKGTYRLEITLEYEMNPIRTIKNVQYSNWFTVLEKE